MFKFDFSEIPPTPLPPLKTPQYMQLILAITFQDFVHHLTSTEGLKGIKHKKKYQIIPSPSQNPPIYATHSRYYFSGLCTSLHVN